MYSILEDKSLACIDQSGTILWNLERPDSTDSWYYSDLIHPAMSPGGDTLYVAGYTHLYKISIEGDIIWSSEADVESTPIVSSRDLVYV